MCYLCCDLVSRIVADSRGEGRPAVCGEASPRLRDVLGVRGAIERRENAEVAFICVGIVVGTC